MRNFIFDSLEGVTDVYFVVCNGNRLVYSNCNKKPCRRVFIRLAGRGDYVELWYRNSTGNDVLVAYAN